MWQDCPWLLSPSLSPTPAAGGQQSVTTQLHPSPSSNSELTRTQSICGSAFPWLYTVDPGQFQTGFAFAHSSYCQHLRDSCHRWPLRIYWGLFWFNLCMHFCNQGNRKDFSLAHNVCSQGCGFFIYMFLIHSVTFVKNQMPSDIPSSSAFQTLNQDLHALSSSTTSIPRAPSTCDSSLPS